MVFSFRNLVISILLLSVAMLQASGVSQNRQVKNLEAFTKLYGYIRFYYPSDEAQSVDWDKFAVYGSKQVMEAENDRELLAKLQELFLPIAPALQISKKKKELKPDLALLTPRSLEYWNETCWQYSGYQNMPRSLYTSRRTFRPVQIKVNPQSKKLMNLVSFTFDSSDLNCKQYRLTFSVKAIEADTVQSGINVMDGWWNYFTDSLAVGEWTTKQYMLERKYPELNDNVYLYFINLKQSALRDIIVEAKQGDNWFTVYSNDFTSDEPGKMPCSLNLDTVRSIDINQSHNTYMVRDEADKRYLAMTASHEGEELTTGFVTKIYDETVPFGTYATRQLAKNLYCSFPLTLYSNMTGTFPPSDETKLNALKAKVDAISTADYDDIATRLAAIEVYWNLLQHFYPYWKNIDADWHKTLRKTLRETLKGGDIRQFEFVIKDMQSQTKDGHRSLISPLMNAKKKPGFTADLVEGKWIVTHIVRDSIDIPIGSEILKINGTNFPKYVKSRRHYYETASRQNTDKWLFFEVINDYTDSVVTFTFRTPEHKRIEKKFRMEADSYSSRFPSGGKVVEYSDSIFCLNVYAQGFTSKDMQDWVPMLANAKGIILDWRNGRGVETDLMGHLLTAPDTLRSFEPGKYLFPDQLDAPIEISIFPTWSVQPIEPHLNAKVVFLSSSGNISYEESYLSYIKYYQLATIIGEPTAGMTGNVIFSSLPGGWKAWWTGLYYENPDGSRFHGVGIIPDIIVHPTVKGVTEGRDEILEAGLKYMQKELGLKELPQEVKSY